MKHISTVLLILIISFTSFAIDEKKEMVKEQKKQIKEAFKETTNASDEDLERFVSIPYK